MMKRLIIGFLLVVMLVLGPVTAVSAGEPVQRFPVPDVSFDITNPCTKSTVTVTWTDLILLTRTGQDANGGTHIVYTLKGSIFDTAGFAGQFLNTMNQNRTMTDTSELTDHFTVIARNPDTHQTIVLHDTLHINFKDGVQTIKISNFDEQCRGKPN